MDASEASDLSALSSVVNAARSRSFCVVTTSPNAFTVDHELKIDPDRLAEIIAGTKTHEIRVFDRDFQVGNILKLNAFNRTTNEYAGQMAIVKVTNITGPGSYGLPETIGVMSIELTRLGVFAE